MHPHHVICGLVNFNFMSHIQSSSVRMGTIIGEEVDHNMKSCIFFYQPNVVVVILSETSNSNQFCITVYVVAKCERPHLSRAVSTALRACLAQLHASGQSNRHLTLEPIRTPELLSRLGGQRQFQITQSRLNAYAISKHRSLVYLRGY